VATSLIDAAPLGGKAGGLARLLGAGLPVPDGVVITSLDDVDEAAVRALGPRLAIRSAMSVEDRAFGSAAGVFLSRTDVAADDALAAIHEVWHSGVGPLAAAYGELHGGEVHAMVIVQRFEPGTRVTIYTRPPGRPAHDEVWIEAAGATMRAAARDADDPWVRLALAAEHAISAADTGADVELIVGAQTWIVQARPIVRPRAVEAVAAPAALFGGLARGVTWRWDLDHNPDPMSPAQCGLVDAITAAKASPWRAATIAGYLYVEIASRSEDHEVPPGGTSDRRNAAEEPRRQSDEDGDVIARFDALAARMDAALDVTPASVADAVAAYVAFYRVFAFEVAPLVASARRARTGPATRPAAALDAAVIAVARGELDEDVLLARAADFAPAWDVAVPTFGEQPALVRAAVTRVRAALPALAPARTDPRTDAIARISEEDDVRFARAQALVRRALLAAGARLGLEDPGDACWLPLADVIAAEAGAPLDADRARARAEGARAAVRRARAWAMPLEICDGVPVTPPTIAGDRWTGVGSGGRVAGVVHRVDHLGDAQIPAGAIAVVATVTPALALLLAGARAIVSERGGVLDHGAAIARELGIPCVVGCAGAWRALRTGDRVELDGDAEGKMTVTRYSSSSSGGSGSSES